MFSEVTQKKDFNFVRRAGNFDEDYGILLTLLLISGCFNKFLFHYCDDCSKGLLPTDLCSLK